MPAPACHLCGLNFSVDKNAKKLKSVKSWKIFPEVVKDGCVASKLANLELEVVKRRGSDETICSSCHSSIKVLENAMAIKKRWQDWGNIAGSDERPKKVFVREVRVDY